MLVSAVNCVPIDSDWVITDLIILEPGRYSSDPHSCGAIAHILHEIKDLELGDSWYRKRPIFKLGSRAWF
jgi:hypothetical protein